MKFRITFACLFAGLALAFLGGKGLITYILPAQYIYAEDCDWTKLRSGQRVIADVDFVIDPFVISSKDNVDVSAVYTIPDLRAGDDELIYMTHFMGILVKRDDFGKYNNIVDASWNWWDDTTETVEWAEGGSDYFEGYLRKMSKQEKEFLNKYLDDMGYSESEKSEMIVPYVMMRSDSFLTYGLMFAGGVILTIIGAVLGFFFFLKKS